MIALKNPQIAKRLGLMHEFLKTSPLHTRERSVKIKEISCRRKISYIQGQSPEPNSREYFYYIDHQGMLFLDDAKMKNFTSCFKEKKFLAFFFSRIRINDTGKYEKDFPFISPCGKEKNFIRCDDLPIVYTHIIDDQGQEDKLHDCISYGHAGDLLKVKFEPEKLCMLPESGRLYHPASEKVGGVGLVKSSLTIQLSKNFVYQGNDPEEMPVSFIWKGEKHQLSQEVLEKLKK